MPTRRKPTTADLPPDELDDWEPEAGDPADSTDPSEPSEPSDLDYEDVPCTDDDDARWDAFIPDDDEFDPEPDRGDFWIENSEPGAAARVRKEVVRCSH